MDLWEWANADSDDDDGGPVCEVRVGPTNPLHVAADVGSVEVIEDLLNEGSIDIDQGNREGKTPLILAAARGHERATLILLQHDANVHALSDVHATALHTACVSGSIEIVHLLILFGSDVEARTFNGYTPLHLSAIGGRAEIMMKLLLSGADYDGREQNGK